MKKAAWAGVLAMAALLTAWAVVRRGRTEAASGPGGSRGAVVEIAPVRRMDIAETGRFSGSLTPRTSFVVASRVSGRMERLYVDIGDSITNGQPIARLDSLEFVQQLEQARAERDIARANLAESLSALDVARRDYERMRSLRAQQVASESELDAAQARFEAAQAYREVAAAQLAQRDAGLEGARIRLSYTQIAAFWENGGRRVIGERFVHEGALLSVNQPIVSVLDLENLIAEVHVIERVYPRLRAGQPALVTAEAYPGRRFDGIVTRVAPLLREASRQARVEIAVPNTDDVLRPGMFVQTEVVFGEHPDAHVVPYAALARRDGQRGVFRYDAATETAHFVPVTTGVVRGDIAQIVDPEIEGSVITLGHHLVEDGMPVRVVAQDSETPDSGDSP